MLQKTAIIVTLILLGGANTALGSPHFKYTPDRGYVDDAVAFDSQGRLAFIHTDASSFFKIVLLDIAKKKELFRLDVRDATRVPRGLSFGNSTNRLLLIWSDTQKGLYGADLFDLDKRKLLRGVRGGKSIRVVPYSGSPAIALSRVKTDRRGQVTTTVELFRFSDLRRIKRRALSVRPDNTIARPALRLLYWERAFTEFVGMRKGKYDKKRDMRLPDVAVRFDLFSRKQTWSHTPKDLLQWNKALQLRERAPRQLRFFAVDTALKPLWFVDRDNSLKKIGTPVPWRLYEPRSLKQSESWDGKVLHFSMTIDPVNPDAVARQKSDKERMDLYRLEAGSAKAIGRVLTNKRGFAWRVGNSHFAYLRKLRGFSRGAKSIELYPLGFGVK